MGNTSTQGSGGAVQSSTSLTWAMPNEDYIAGYKIYWRATTAPQWEHFKYVRNVGKYTLEGLVIENYLFCIAAVGQDGSERVVVFLSGLTPKNR